jgi:hypothetical protein
LLVTYYCSAVYKVPLPLSTSYSTKDLVSIVGLRTTKAAVLHTLLQQHTRFDPYKFYIANR